MYYRLSWNGQHLTQTQSGRKYFDWSLINRPNDAVYVDGGAYDGRSVIDFVDAYGENYGTIHAFEPFPNSFGKLEANCSQYPNISLIKKGLWNAATTLMYAGTGQSVTVAMRDSIAKPDGSIETITLDEYLDEPPSLIKMDMEGAEVCALHGAKNSIKAGMAQLAICAYHLMDDLRTIPRLITDISDDYTLALRNYKTRGSAEIVMYARA